MRFFEFLAIAVGLAMDAFAVSLAAGSSELGCDRRATFRLSFHFGLFQFLMPLIGWLAGMSVAASIQTVDHWIAFGLLVFIGVKMIRSAAKPKHEKEIVDPSRGMTLIALSVATSVDALAVGLSLAMIQVNIWYPSAVIGLVTAGISLLGVKLGDRLGSMFGKRMEMLGGVILIMIGLKILFSHLSA